MSEVMKLKHVARIRPSNVDKKTVDGERAVSLCNYTDVYYNDVIRSDLRFMSASATLDQVRQFELRAGDVVITKDSETADDIVIPAFIAEDLPGVLCGYHLSLIRPNRDRLDPKFLFWCMSSSMVRSQAENYAAGITRVGIRSDLVGSLLLPYRSVEGQRAIANYLDVEASRIDALIAMKRHLISLVEERTRVAAQEVLAAAMEDGVPVRLKAVLQTIDERRGDRADLPLLSVSIHRGVVLRDSLTDDLPRADDLSNYKRCRPGDVVLNRMRAFQGAVGLSAYEGIVSTDYMVLRPRTGYDGRFLHYLYRSPRFVGEMTARLRGIGTSEQGNVRTPRVNAEDLLDIRERIPAEPVQRDIAAMLDAKADGSMLLSTRLADQVALLSEHRQALITAAVTGEIDVPGTPA